MRLIPGEVVLSGFGTILILLAYVALSLSRTREKVARLEEWARLTEKRLNGIDR